MRLSSKIHPLLFAVFFLGFSALPAAATTYYVDINSPNPGPPYTSWNTASTNIQSAIDQSANGDLVLVNDGVYQTGGEIINQHQLTNRVVINKSITVQSVDGPAATIIRGFSPPLNGFAGIRCVYMTNNSALIGFTLSGGDAFITTTNQIYDLSGGGVWCETTNATLSNCVITGNSAGHAAGGVYQGTLLNCTIFQNSIVPVDGYGYGGGVYQSVLVNCMVISNAITNLDGFSPTAYGCGAYNSELTNCLVAGNWTTPAYIFLDGGGGAYQGTLVNCTITGNTASYGGGTFNATLINCINYYNMAADPASTNYYSGSLSYCCTLPLPFGTGNITNVPQLASVSCIGTNSPCRGAGNAAATIGVDINGNPWANPPSIGCDEPNPGNVVGTNLSAVIITAFTNYPPGYVANFQANISGPVSASVWNFGDGTIVTNMPFISHAWPALGTYPVTLTAYNDTYSTGVTANLTINISTSLVYYVNLNSRFPAPPYRTWSSAASTIQDAVNAANPGSLVLVTNGTTSAPNTNHNAMYLFGGMTAPNGNFYRMVVTNPITVESVNGPATTYIVGLNNNNSAGCAYLTNGAALIGFTLTNGNFGGIYAVSTNVIITNCVIIGCPVNPVESGTLFNCLITKCGSSGYAGAEGSVLNNCTLSGTLGIGAADCVANNCVISNSANCGVFGGILNNCLITHNSAAANGGGAYGDVNDPIVLNNCVISYNTAPQNGGGVYGVFSPVSTNCILNNCLVVSNSVNSGGGGAYQAQLNNCIVSNNATMPLPGRVGGGVEDSILNNCLLISNSAYMGGGAYLSQLTNCLLIGNFASSAGGGAYNGTLYDSLIVSNTAGDGGGANNATLNQCTILNNISLGGHGGGVGGSTLNNCLISSNMVLNAANPNFTGGGGVYNSKLTNCLLTYNTSATNGGGAYQSTLVNCTVAFNAGTTGGVFQCQAKNCVLYYNANVDFSPATSQFPLNYCCTMLPATNGFFNITNAPLFVNMAGNDFHLQSISPCINSGNNSYVTTSTDLDGNPRIVGGTVDIGAYEYQTPTSVISYAYLQKYGLPTDGSVDFANLDGTGFNVYQDWIAGLNPTNPASILVMLPPPATNNPSGITISWQSVSGVSYFLQRTTNLPAPWATIQSNLTGNAGTTTYSDTSATNGTPYFYRVGVQAP